jgi:hypothetical protein
MKRARARPWLLALAGCAAAPAGEPPWRPLFDGRSLAGFEITDFGGQGEVAVRDGRIRLGPGSPLTGITWRGDMPAGDYELRIVAAREQGSDFFCGVTFPVGDAHLTCVLGGWGGSLCGFSSLDGLDAAHNDTRTFRSFVAGRNYELLLHVRTDLVEARLDGEVLCRIDPRRHRLGLRPEVSLSRPLGIAAFATEASLRAVQWRPLPEAAQPR